jgi:cytochrome c551/c552
MHTIPRLSLVVIAPVWGEIPMPPNPQVPEKELDDLVKWILAQK